MSREQPVPRGVITQALVDTFVHFSGPSMDNIKIVYETVGGFFAQDHPAVDPTSVGAVPSSFGLLDGSPDRWHRFKYKVDFLNVDADDDVSYKVFFLARHGEGFHNVGQAKHGTEAWDNHWSLINGDDEIIWGPDPTLTEIGKSQAAAAHAAWETELHSNIPLPEKLYCSPLTRAMQTHIITFDGIIKDDNRKTVVVENCREEYGSHTCDKRRSKTYIRTEFPQFEVESHFSEEDELWKAQEREPQEHIAARARLVLDRVFTNDPETFIYITAHGGIINGFLSAVGRPRYALATGGILPIVVKGTRILGK